MIDDLASLYETKVFNRNAEILTEGEKVKGTTISKAGPIPGQEKVKTMAKGTGPEGAEGIDKPQEAPKDLNPGHGKIQTENKEMKKMLPDSQFEKLFRSTVVNEELGDNPADESPVEQGKFDEEEGDFPVEGEGGEESTEAEQVDVATELRMIIDRLTEVAERIGAYDEGEEEGAEGAEGVEGVESVEGDVAPAPAPVGEAAVATKELKPLPDTASKMMGKGNMKVKSAVSSPDGGKSSAGGPGKKDADGKLKDFPDSVSKMTGKGNMKVSTTSRMSKQGASLFGN